MPIYPSSHGRETGSQDWEIVPTDWWRTHYSSVSWVHIQDPPEDKRFQHRQYQGSLFPGPLLVHVIERRRPPSGKDDARGHGETGLNVELVGVKGAMEAVVAYETSVGFYYQPFPKIEPEELESLIALNLSTRIINVEDTRVHQIRWNELLNDLMHSPLPGSPSDSDEASELGASPSSAGDSLLQSTSTLSSVDLTSSESSLESQPMPSTPRARFPLHHPIEVKDKSPTGSIRISPIRSLSALASSFIPTSSAHAHSHDDVPLLHETSRSSSKLPSFSNFIFPSLNPPASSTSSAQVKLRKDSEGFFTEESSNTTPTPLLPPFLQESSQRNARTRKSRTRELVDRLRSELVPTEERASNLPKGRHTVSPKYASYCPSPNLLDDFALSLIKPRRSLSEDGSGEQRQHRQTASTTSLSASASASTSRHSTPEVEDDDGWIDIADPRPSRSSPKDKTNRTRELFMALTRRRTDSASPEILRELMNQATTQGSEGATFAEESTDVSTASAPSPPSPPLPRTDIIRSVSTSPSMPRTATVASNDGWVETASILQEHASKVPHKEKTPRKETHFRKKSHNNNPSPSPWARGSAFQPTPPSMPPHLLHPPNLPLSSFPPPSTSTAFPRPVLPPQVMPPTPTATGPGAMPYFFSSYPNLPMSVRLPPVNYPTASYNGMSIPNVYPMAAPPPVPLQSYMPAPSPFPGVAPGGYVNASRTSMPPLAKMSGFTTAHPSGVTGGTGYSGLNGSKIKW
jgi:hypothetical protein